MLCCDEFFFSKKNQINNIKFIYKFDQNSREKNDQE